MSRKPWFRKHGASGGFVPVTPEGWAVFGLFVVALLATVMLPPSDRPFTLIGLALFYLALSFWFSGPR